jgi:hypothetical protein
VILARPNPRKKRRCPINCSRFDATRRLLSLASRMTGLCRCRGWQWGSLRGFIERGGAGPLWRRLRLNAKSSVGLPIALPQVLTTGGSGRIATSLKTGFPASGVSSFGERAGVASFGRAQLLLSRAPFRPIDCARLGRSLALPRVSPSRGCRPPEGVALPRVSPSQARCVVWSVRAFRGKDISSHCVLILR